MDEITLVVDVDPDNGMYYFFVKQGEETLCFNHGFRTREQAMYIGDLWIREQLNATPKQDIQDS